MLAGGIMVTLSPRADTCCSMSVQGVMRARSCRKLSSRSSSTSFSSITVSSSYKRHVLTESIKSDERDESVRVLCRPQNNADSARHVKSTSLSSFHLGTQQPGLVSCSSPLCQTRDLGLWQRPWCSRPGKPWNCFLEEQDWWCLPDPWRERPAVDALDGKAASDLDIKQDPIYKCLDCSA